MNMHGNRQISSTEEFKEETAATASLDRRQREEREKTLTTTA
jgi:hypothetical protein